MSANGVSSRHFDAASQWLVLSRKHANIVAYECTYWSGVAVYCETGRTCVEYLEAKEAAKSMARRERVKMAEFKEYDCPHLRPGKSRRRCLAVAAPPATTNPAPKATRCGSTTLVRASSGSSPRRKSW